MLMKETVIDRVEILEDGRLQVRQATYIVEDGVRIFGPNFHRTSLPKDHTAELTTVAKRVQEIASEATRVELAPVEEAIEVQAVRAVARPKKRRG
jgi:hypothetical protein